MSTLAKWYWIAVFTVATALTIVVNGAHAGGSLATPGTWTARLVAAAPPAIFAALALGAHISHAHMPRRMRRLAYSAVGALGAATFAVSYETSRLFVIAEPGPLPAWTGWVIPGMLDTLVFVSGVVLYSVTVEAHQSTEAASTETVTSSWWSRRLGETDAVRAAKTAKKLAQIHAETEAISTATTSTENPQVAAPVEAPQAAVDAQTEPREDSTDATVDALTPSTDALKPSTKSSTERRRKPTVEPLDPKLEPFMEAARQMQADGIVTRKNEKFFAEIIRAIEVSGASNNSIKTRGLASAAAADTVRQAWTRWKSEHETVADLERRLVSVS